MKKTDLGKGPVKHLIHIMKRLKAKEIDPETGKQTGKTKEYLTLVLRHESSDWLGRPIASPEVVGGRYQKWLTQIDTMGYSPETGEPIIAERLATPVIVHYIEWEGKKTLDQIFKTYPGSEDSLEECVFYCEYGGNGRDGTKERCNLYSFEQFRDSEFQHLVHLGKRIGGPTGNHALGKVDPSQAVFNTCECTQCKKHKTRKGIS